MSQTRLINRSTDAVRERYRTFFESPFMPNAFGKNKCPTQTNGSLMRRNLPRIGSGRSTSLAMAVLLTLLAISGPAVAGPIDDAEAAYGRSDYATALPLFRLLADQGVATAQYRLGHLYDDGTGVTQDYVQALRWYRLAADQGIAAAQFGLGTIYENGQSVPQDFVLAHMWFNLSASQGNKAAALNRDELATSMNPAQVTEAQKLAREWDPKAKR